jgi:hypothetical protein
MPIETATDLDYLIPELRLHLWDIDPTSYRYLDSWLRVALVLSIKSLQRWWRIRYTIDSSYVVSRFANSSFSIVAPPVIMQADEEPILLMASILIKSGVLQDSSWDVGTWRDAEIYVSNIEGGRLKNSSIAADWERLLGFIKPPQSRLNAGGRESIPGASEY